MAAVLVRETPETAERDIGLLSGLHFDVADGPAVMQQACRLSIALKQHLFDTLYHAVALETDATLISADRRYYTKARRTGRVVYLADWVCKDQGVAHYPGSRHRRRLAAGRTVNRFRAGALRSRMARERQPGRP